MTLLEFFGLIGGVVLGIATSVAVWLLGYGWVAAGIALPIGFLVGWGVGIAITHIVVLAERPTPADAMQDGDSATRPDSDERSE